ncbi:hypothetical protein PoB_000127600 [Plakobranchus ocellatus]|uniref:Uncharacterized protein n=1 Tax=Plakobranchus ocellatus TaxID=259542 RepID=A0AAV3XXG2_9GAST|nr:hypothetical protein PoB_000127600 [Plakobranchus ocellatus]
MSTSRRCDEPSNSKLICAKNEHVYKKRMGSLGQPLGFRGLGLQCGSRRLIRQYDRPIAGQRADRLEQSR